MNKETKKFDTQDILDALKTVRYPGEEGNIVSSGMVQNDITIEGNKVTFSIRFKKVKDPLHKSIIKAAESAILTFVSPDIGIKGNITPIFPEAPEPKSSKVLPKVKNIIAISSGKGGVGKSTVTANLAVALSMMGYKVGVLDADIFGPSMPRMLDLEDARPELVEIDGRDYIRPAEKYGVKMLSIGFFVEKDSAIVWRGSMASNALGQLITEGNWGELDFLLMDLPPGTSDIHLTLIQTVGITGAIVVTTPQNVALDDARKGISMFRDDKINVPLLGIVENMSWFTPAELPQNRYYIFGEEGGKKLAEELNIPLLGQLPLVQSVRESADTGVPIACNEESIMGIAFHRLAENVVSAVEKRNSELPPTQKVEVTLK